MITENPPRPTDASTAVTEVDVVVIGAGHNGLVAANYIADGGDQVLVVEACIAGWWADVIRADDPWRHPIIWSTTSRSTRSSGTGFPPREGLGWRRITAGSAPLSIPALRVPAPGWRVGRVLGDPQKTANEIAHFSPKDGAAYMEFGGLLMAMSDLLLAFGIVNPTRNGPRTAAEGRPARRPVAQAARRRHRAVARDGGGGDRGALRAPSRPRRDARGRRAR